MSWNYHRKIRKKGVGFVSNENAQDLRKEVINLLGGKCSNPACLVPGGCSDIRCLQIDHIGGLENGSRKSHIRMYFEILDNPDVTCKKYQLLCANCNWIKRVEKHELAHCYQKRHQKRNFVSMRSFLRIPVSKNH